MLRFVCVRAFLMLDVRGDKWPWKGGAPEAPAGLSVVEAVSGGWDSRNETEILFGYSAEVMFLQVYQF